MTSRAEGTLFGILGAGSLGLAWLMHTDKLPRNQLVGMRTGATTVNDAAWLAGHRASAGSVALAGVILLGSSLWLLLAHQSTRQTRTVVLGSSILVGVLIVIGGLQADHAAKEVLRATSG